MKRNNKNYNNFKGEEKNNIKKVGIIIYFVMMSVMFQSSGLCNKAGLKRKNEMVKIGIKLLHSDDLRDRIKGAGILKEYHTYYGLRELINCWILEKDNKVTEEIVKAIESYEEFRLSESFIKWVSKKIDITVGDEKELLKYKYLLEKSQTKEAKRLLNNIDSILLKLKNEIND